MAIAAARAFSEKYHSFRRLDALSWPDGLLRGHNTGQKVKNKLSVFQDAQVFALRPFSTSRDALAFQFVGVC